MNDQGWVTDVGLKSVHPQEALESYTRNELDDSELIAALVLRCLEDSDAIWQALSLLDQYHRRGLLETGLFLTAKTELSIESFDSPDFRSEATGQPNCPSPLDQFSRGALD